MNLDKIKQKIAMYLGRDPKTYRGTLTRVYNEIEAQKTEQGLKDLGLPDEQFERIILLGVLKKYEIPAEKLDEFLSEDPTGVDLLKELEEEESTIEEVEVIEEKVIEKIEVKGKSSYYIKKIVSETGMTAKEIMVMVKEKQNELRGLISEEGALFLISKDLGIDIPESEEEKKPTFKRMSPSILADIKSSNKIESSDWKGFLKSLPKNDNGIKRTPNLVIKDNIKFFLKINVKEEPYNHKGDGKDGKPFESWKFVVTLVKMDDEDSYEDVWEGGDFSGQPMYVDGQEYGFWLSYKRDKWSPMDSFAQFWTDKCGLDDFDGRVFGLKRSKKKSKAGRLYSVYKFFQVE